MRKFSAHSSIMRILCFLKNYYERSTVTQTLQRHLCTATCRTRKLSNRKDDRAMRPISIWCPEKYRELRPLLLLPKFEWTCSDRSCECAYKIEFRIFTRSWDNRGYSKIRQSLDTPTLSFLQNF